MLTITIFDADGNVISETTEVAEMASDAEISEMIHLIEAGSPAWLAAQMCRALAVSDTQHASNERKDAT